MPFSSSPDIHRVAWAYVVGVLGAVDDDSPVDHGHSLLLASQLETTKDLVALSGSLLELAIRLWVELHGDDIHAALLHAQELAIDMAGTPG